jgi:hypothetical protein
LISKKETNPVRRQETAMSVENRAEYLFRAAERAEREGNARLAEILRRMAEELLPVDPTKPGARLRLSHS